MIPDVDLVKIAKTVHTVRRRIVSFRFNKSFGCTEVKAQLADGVLLRQNELLSVAPYGPPQVEQFSQ